MRDASVYDRPNVWSPKKAHVWGKEYMSGCGRAVLDETFIWHTLADVPAVARCQARGCKEKWPQ